MFFVRYLTIRFGDKDSLGMFYFFFESRKAKANPVVIWLTGGPGCTSELALFYENGPFKISNNMSLVWNDYDWDKAHPNYINNDFYITGESYVATQDITFHVKKSRKNYKELRTTPSPHQPRRLYIGYVYNIERDSNREFSTSEYTNIFSHISNEYGSELDDDSTVAWEREFMQGVLMKERVKNYSGALLSKRKQQSNRHTEVKQKSCVDTFEGHKSYCLTLIFN
ncbi:hypothetical protein L2E82_47595 [Cichorium intybus]|uniref:Uncharacterized protein n=1 Tax=Cichorium intybus TaxID=13427 RepID=A0ACB8YW21_CICIN|nr:hypothetical protein L2E82_47595 [Cichorium intybus]